MKVGEVILALEKLAPTEYAEGFDNVGLLVGDSESEVSKILVTLDTTEEVVDEAIFKGANLIVSFHPIIFSGMKKLIGQTYVERVVQKAIKHDISIYAIHTALDNSRFGVNHMICSRLNLENTEILIPKQNTLRHLVTYAPISFADQVRQALNDAGAGEIGEYDNCSFNIEGTGVFRPSENSNSYIGQKGKVHFEKEIRISVLIPIHKEKNILKALKEVHPYEEIAYEIFELSNPNQTIGMGMIGELEEEMSEKDFFKYLKERMQVEVIRHSKLLDKKIKKVAVLGGSGSFAISNAKRKKADVYVTADLKYHDFFQAEEKILLADVGHYESEQFTKKLLTTYLSEKFRNFAVLKSEINTNPVHYS